ncbi:hypothetical protein BKA83DRAFT_4497552 [Pisolithus microcarpus]|nr:hypothetical protein BKA83DRAFT_4497552 [Pisolithus microcarpus]
MLAVWESLKQDYYAASAIAGGLGLAYSAEKGTNIITEVGQLIMDELVEAHLQAAQFCSKGFKYLEHMQRFVPPNKGRSTNAHHTSTFIMPPTVSPHPAVMWPAMQVHPSQYQPLAMQPSSQLTFVPYQPRTPGQATVMQTTQDMQPAVISQVNPVSHMTPSVVSHVALPPPANSSPLSIPISPPSSVMMSVNTSLNPSSSASSRGRKHKTDATAGLDSLSTVASSVVTTSVN